MGLLEWLEETNLSVWIATSETVWGYPIILTLHTMGLALLVGASAVVDLRVLGWGERVALDSMRWLTRPMLIGFAVNAFTGILLFIAAATVHGVNPIFYVKLVLIVLALGVGQRLWRALYPGGVASSMASQQARMLAIASLVLWVAAIATGRLMAYL
jgi:hypothetical protein